MNRDRFFYIISSSVASIIFLVLLWNFKWYVSGIFLITYFVAQGLLTSANKKRKQKTE